MDSRENVLPLQYYILGLPVDRNFSINLVINFAYQLFSQVNMLIFFISYIPMTAILMNHMCLMCDLGHELIRVLESSLKDADIALFDETERNTFDENLKKLVNATYDIIEWRKQAQNLLSFSFLADFSLLSVVLCMSVTSITSGWSDLLTAAPAFFVCTSQLFVYCWLGSRIEYRYETISATLFGMNWERLHGNQRRDVQLILLMCQNLSGFNGIFKTVNLSTFQKVRNQFILKSIE